MAKPIMAKIKMNEITNMSKINIVNLIMFIITMVKFIMAKPTMSQLIMVKFIMLN